MKKDKKKKEFSKIIIIQESVLIWVVTLAFLGLAYLCVLNGYDGSLPWLTISLASPWAAYGISQAYYYNKAKAQNTTGGITYEMAMKQDKEEKCDEGE
jgi:EamA domain-containing membrane protein RarD